MNSIFMMKLKKLKFLIRLSYFNYFKQIYKNVIFNQLIWNLPQKFHKFFSFLIKVMIIKLIINIRKN